MFERFLNPRYHIRILKLSDFEPEKIVAIFRRKGAHVHELGESIDVELAIESFIASSYGDYVYVVKLPKGRTFLAGHTKKLYETKWPEAGRYIARDESGLKRFLLREVSRKSMILIEVSRIAIWGAVWWVIWSHFKEYTFGAFLLLFLGFVLDELSKVLEYLILGYCRE